MSVELCGREEQTRGATPQLTQPVLCRAERTDARASLHVHAAMLRILTKRERRRVGAAVAFGAEEIVHAIEVELVVLQRHFQRAATCCSSAACCSSACSFACSSAACSSAAPPTSLTRTSAASLEELPQHPRHQPLLDRVDAMGLSERVRLSGTRLAVGEQRCVIPFEQRHHQRPPHRFVHAAVGCQPREDAVRS